MKYTLTIALLMGSNSAMRIKQNFAAGVTNDEIFTDSQAKIQSQKVFPALAQTGSKSQFAAGVTNEEIFADHQAKIQSLKVNPSLAQIASKSKFAAGVTNDEIFSDNQASIQSQKLHSIAQTSSKWVELPDCGW